MPRNRSALRSISHSQTVKNNQVRAEVRPDAVRRADGRGARGWRLALLIHFPLIYFPRSHRRQVEFTFKCHPLSTPICVYPMNKSLRLTGGSEKTFSVRECLFFLAENIHCKSSFTGKKSSILFPLLVNWITAGRIKTPDRQQNFSLLPNSLQTQAKLQRTIKHIFSSLVGTVQSPTLQSLAHDSLQIKRCTLARIHHLPH